MYCILCRTSDAQLIFVDEIDLFYVCFRLLTLIQWFLFLIFHFDITHPTVPCTVIQCIYIYIFKYTNILCVVCTDRYWTHLLKQKPSHPCKKCNMLSNHDWTDITDDRFARNANLVGNNRFGKTGTNARFDSSL